MKEEKSFNVNHDVIIYPNAEGFVKIRELLSEKYKLLSDDTFEALMAKRTTPDGGYKDQLWSIIADLHGMFYNGQNYLRTTKITLVEEHY